MIKKGTEDEAKGRDGDLDVENSTHLVSKRATFRINKYDLLKYKNINS